MTAKRILVPIDGSERSEDIVPLVAALARDTGATVRLLRIYRVPQRVVRDTGETISYAATPRKRMWVATALGPFL